MLFMNNLIAIFRGPTIAQINHRAGVRVTSTSRIGFAVPTMRRRAKIMQVIGDRHDVAVSVGIEMLSTLPLISGSLNDVIQVRNHAGGDECLAVIVEVDAPRIARPVCEHVEFMPCRMVTPDRSSSMAHDRHRACPACRLANA